VDQFLAATQECLRRSRGVLDRLATTNRQLQHRIQSSRRRLDVCQRILLETETREGGADRRALPGNRFRSAMLRGTFFVGCIERPAGASDASAVADGALANYLGVAVSALYLGDEVMAVAGNRSPSPALPPTRR
jgi:hypothetical protein